MPHILVVEDSPTEAGVLRIILESEGFVVDHAADATAALARLRAAAYDLVLSDVVMPGLSGYDLCRQVKAEPRTRQTPVVLLTHLADPLDILQGLECGADNFITKPFDRNHLVRRLRGILANRRAPGAPEAGTLLSLRGRGVTITSEKEQILDLLLATLEDFVRAQAREREVRLAKEALEREAALEAESARRRNLHLAMLAHELRNPLAPMLTSLPVLRQADADPAARQQSVERLERQVRHLSRLLDDLLDASRVAHGKVSLRPERLDLARVVRTAAEDHRASLEQAGLELAVQTPQTPVWHTGDPTRLAQVFHNLLDNAAKYSCPGGRVSVQLSVDGGQAVATVADTGQGIAPEVLPQLFQPFAQAEQGLDRSAGGLGLGLSVVRGLVELHGGSVEAASGGTGCGATFTVRLPVEGEPAALAPTAEPPARSRDRRRVLLIEDNRDAADGLSLLLGLLGHEVRVAYTGPDGVEAAAQWRPDVVVSDIGLPGFDGFEVAKRIRGVPGMAEALLVALTGYGQEEDRRRGREAGFDHHLVKPADPEDLQRVLEDHVA